MDLINTVTAKSHATHIEIFIDGCHWTNSTESIKKIWYILYQHQTLAGHMIL